MEDTDNPFRAALEQDMAPEPVRHDDNPFRAALDPVGHATAATLEQAKRDKWTWDRLASGLKEIGVDPEEFRAGKSQIDVAAARKKIEETDTGPGTFQLWSRGALPFSSLIPNKYLPGARNVDPREYNDAVNKLKAGTELSPQEAETVALYEHQREEDERLRKKSGPLLRVVQELGNLGGLYAETALGMGALSKGAGALGKVGQALGVVSKPAVAAAPVEYSLGRKGLNYAASRVLPTTVAPSMYVQAAQQKNIQEGRADINDPKGYPAAFTYAYANMLVLGQLQKGVGPNGPSLVKGALGVGELTAVDALAETLDKYVLSKPWQTGAKSNVSKYFEALEKGDVDEQNRAATDVAIQTLAFSAMARLHKGEDHGAPTEIMNRYADAMDAMRKSGVSRRQRNDSIAKIHTALEGALRENPYLTRAEAKEAAAAAAAKGTERYAAALADGFEVTPYVPQRRPRAPEPEPQTAAEPAPEAPEAPKTPAPVAAAATQPAPAVKPKPKSKSVNPEPGETLAEFTGRARGMGLPESLIKAFAENHPQFQGQKVPEKPDPSVAVVGEDAFARRDRLTELLRVRQAEEAERIQADTRSGTAPEVARNRSKDRLKELVAKVEAARSEALKAEADGLRPSEPSRFPQQPPAPTAPAPAAPAPRPVEPRLHQEAIVKLKPGDEVTGATLQRAMGIGIIDQMVREKWLEPIPGSDRYRVLGPEAPVEQPAVEQTPVAAAATPVPPVSFSGASRTSPANAPPARGGSAPPAAFFPGAEASVKQTPVAAAATPVPPVSPVSPVSFSGASRTSPANAPPARGGSAPPAAFFPGAEASVKPKPKPKVFGAPPPKLSDLKAKLGSRQNPTPKPKLDMPSPERAEAQTKLTNALAANPDLTPEQRKRYGDALQGVLDAMPQRAMEAIADNLNKITFHENTLKLSEANAREWLSDPNLHPADVQNWTEKLNKVLSGKPTTAAGYNGTTGNVHLDGGEPGSQGRYGFSVKEGGDLSPIYAHEFGHVLHGKDYRPGGAGEIWEQITKEEVAGFDKDGRPLLTKYAAVHPTESFAEFTRILYSGDVPHAQIARDFPKASAYFKKLGFWPEKERTGPETKPTEVFTERVGTPENHVDVGPKEPETVAAAAAETPKGKSVAELSAEAKRQRDTFDRFEKENGWRYDAVNKAASDGERARAEKELDEWEASLPLEQQELYARIEKANYDLAKANDRQYAVMWKMPDGRVVEVARSNTAEGANNRLRREGAARNLGDLSKTWGRDGVDEHGEPASLLIGESSVDKGSWRMYVEPVKFKEGPADGWWDKKIAKAEEEFKRRPAAPVAAAATKSESKPEPDALELWNVLDYDGKKALAGDKEWRAKLEAAGLDVPSELRKALARHNAGHENRTQKKAGELVIPDDLARDLDRIDTEQKYVDALRLHMQGFTFKQIAEKMTKMGGKKPSHQTVKNWAEKALQELKNEPETERLWSPFESAGDAAKAVEDAQQKEVLKGDARRGATGREDVINEVDARLGPDGDVGGALFAGLPLRLTFLDGLLGKPGESGQGIGSRFRRFFLGGLPEAAKVAKEEALDQQMAAHALDIRQAEKDFRKALADTGRRYEDLSAEGIKELNDLLQNPAGEIPALAAAAKIPAPVADALVRMRRHIDLMSQKLMDIGAVDGPLAEEIAANIGTYLKRQYRVFDDPKWLEKVDKEVVNRFKSWLRQELTPERGPNKGVAPSAEQIDALTKTYLVDGTAAENPVKWLSESRLGAKDLSILKGRKDIPPELRALWGEYQDPLINYVNSVASLSQLVTRHQFLTRVAQENMGKLFFAQKNLDKYAEAFPEAGAAVTFSESDNMGPLKDTYTTKEIKDAFTEVFSNRNQSALMRWYMKGLVVTKYGKTVLSPVTHARNTWGNLGFVIANGHWRAGHGAKAVRAIRDDTPAGREYYRRLTELGVVGDAVTANEIHQSVKDAYGGVDLANELRGNPALSDKAIARAVRKGADAVTRLYHAEDAVFKIYAFENEKVRYAEAYPHWSPAEVERHAANIVRATYPTYSKVAPGIRALRALPIAPFVSFPAEVLRTTINTLRIGIGELADKRTRAIGATRLAGLAAAATLSAGIGMVMRGILGITQDEEEAVRRHLPDYQKDSRLIFFNRDDKGRPKYIDASRTDPHSHLTDALIAFGRGKGTVDGLKLAAKELSKPFTQEELLTKAAVDVFRNDKGGPFSESGGPVWNEQDSLRNKVNKGMEHLAAPFTPGVYSQGRKVIMGLSGKAEEKSGRTYDALNESQKMVTGQGFEKLDLETSLQHKAQAFDKGQADAAHLTQEKLRAKGAVTQQDVLAAKAQTDKARQELMTELQKDVDAARRLGMTDKDVYVILKRAGLSDAEVGQALGKTPLHPYLPKVSPLATDSERARTIDVLKAEQTKARQAP